MKDAIHIYPLPSTGSRMGLPGISNRSFRKDGSRDHRGQHQDKANQGSG